MARFPGYQDLKSGVYLPADEPGDVLAPGVPAEGTMDLRTYLSLALGLPDVASGGSAYRLPLWRRSKSGWTLFSQWKHLALTGK